MGGIASSAIYIASTLSSGGPAAPELPPALPPKVEVSKSAPREYMIVDLPVAGGGRVSVNAAIAETVRLDADNALALSPPLKRNDADLNADVVAAHSERIALIEQQIAAIRQGEGAGPSAVLAGLDEKLRRAKAARGLAEGRVASAKLDSCAQQARAVCRTRPGTAVASATPVLAPAHPAVRARLIAVQATARVQSPSRSQAAAHSSAAPRIAVAPNSFSPRPQHAIDRSMPRLSASAHSFRSAAETQGRTPHGDHLNEGLAYARSKLAEARAALEGTDTQAQPALRLAGLWQWDGSETWSLRSGSAQSA